MEHITIFSKKRKEVKSLKTLSYAKPVRRTKLLAQVFIEGESYLLTLWTIDEVTRKFVLSTDILFRVLIYIDQVSLIKMDEEGVLGAIEAMRSDETWFTRRLVEGKVVQTVEKIVLDIIKTMAQDNIGGFGKGSRRNLRTLLGEIKRIGRL